MAASPQARREEGVDQRFGHLADPDSVLYWVCSNGGTAGLRADEEGVIMKSHPKKEEQTLRPVGIALAAVVAGLSSGKAVAADAHPHAPLEPVANEKTYVADPTNHPGFEEDANMVIGRSTPVAPFAKR
jgi:hypothetical protein